MARKKKSCPPAPKVSLRKVKRPTRRRATPEVDTSTVFAVCASGPRGDECRSAATRAGFVFGEAQASKTGKIKDPKGFTFESRGTPCNADRFSERDPKKCPVQTVWRDGQMFMRICQGVKKPLMEVEVGRDPKKIRRVVAAACQHWSENLSWNGYKP